MIYFLSFKILKSIWNSLLSIIIVNVICGLIFGFLVIKVLKIVVIIMVMGFVGLVICEGVFL